MSLWWSFTLTAFGAAGMLLAYRSYSSYVGPAMGIAIQFVWIAYGIATAQWWFIVGAFIYGGSHLYGIQKRQRERTPRSIPVGRCVEVVDTPPLNANFDPPPYGRQRFQPDLNLVGNLEGSQREIRRVRKFIKKGLRAQRRGLDHLPVPPPTVVVQDQERPLRPGETESQRWGDFDF